MKANLRMRIACKIAGFGIRLMPEKWRTREAVGNLMATGYIDNGMNRIMLTELKEGIDHLREMREGGQ